uniref:Uncharacterized protein n=1 Tax=Aegilops tauschii subsp. strangulata TaxID=200361 RepID=A0A453FMS2_AEGTS
NSETLSTSESNQEKVTGTVGFAVESEQKKVIANADDSSEEQCLLQKPTLGTDVGEETPLLLSTESINSLSYSSEQHSKVVKDIPMTNITLMQAKDEAVEESEKSPLLSPREPSEGAFRAPNHSLPVKRKCRWHMKTATKFDPSGLTRAEKECGLTRADRNCPPPPSRRRRPIQAGPATSFSAPAPSHGGHGVINTRPPHCSSR